MPFSSALGSYLSLIYFKNIKHVLSWNWTCSKLNGFGDLCLTD